MAVYVDALVQYDFRPTARCSGRWCHLTADARDELHRFAAKLGLKRSWFQEHGHQWHYDLTPTKRALAVRRGAQSISRMEMGRLMLRRRAQSTTQTGE